jgi:hypothetical protein
MNLKTGENLGISVSILHLLCFALNHYLLLPPWNQERTEMMDNTFMKRDRNYPQEQHGLGG